MMSSYICTDEVKKISIIYFKKQLLVGLDFIWILCEADIATWKQEILNLLKRTCNTRARTQTPCYESQELKNYIIVPKAQLFQKVLVYKT